MKLSPNLVSIAMNPLPKSNPPLTEKRPDDADSSAPKRGRFGLSLSDGYERFLRIRGTPREIALGFALGIFIGMSPTLGFQMAIAAFIAACLKWNKISAAAGVWISNPLTIPVIYGGTYYVGSKCLGCDITCNFPEEPTIESLILLLKQTPELFWILTVGGVVLGLPLAVAGYYLALWAVERYRTKETNAPKNQDESIG